MDTNQQLTLLDRLMRLFTPGPFPWVTKSQPPKQRFHVGAHLHGLEEHDIPLPPPPPRRPSA